MTRTRVAHLGATLAFALVFAVAPLSAQASNATFFGPIVPPECNCTDQANPNGGTIDTAPSYGCVLATVENAVNFGITIGVVAATLALVFAGFTWMTSVGNPEARSKGRTMLINVFVGLLILLSAWLVVDFIMKKLYNSTSYGPWNSILSGDVEDQCIVATSAQHIDGPLGGLANGIVGGEGGNGTAGGGATGSGPGGANAIGSGGTTTGAPSATTPNGGSRMNIAAAVRHLDSAALSGPSGQCGVWIRRAIAAGGLSAFNSGVGNAWQMGTALRSAGFQPISATNYSPRAGDVVVFQPVPGHSNGHIEMWDGTQWVSDWKQAGFYPITVHSRFIDLRVEELLGCC